MKECSRCKKSLPLCNFNLRNKSLGLPHSYCKKCHVASVNEWRSNNRDRRNRSNRDLYRRRRDAIRQYMNEWAEKNKDRTKRYMHDKNHRRRARMAGAAGSHTADQRDELRASYLGRCVYCFSDIATDFDHVVPLFLGGSNDIENLVPSCSTCNSSKGRSSLLSFLVRRAS